MSSVNAQYNNQRKGFMNFKVETVYSWIMGIVSGGIAYLSGPPLWISWGQMGELGWSFLVSIVCAAGGWIAKYVFDRWIKRRLDRWFPKRNKRVKK